MQDIACNKKHKKKLANMLHSADPRVKIFQEDLYGIYDKL